MADLGILEPQKSHGAVYPLMDWAAKEGHLNLLKLLHAHPFATKTCSDATFRWAVVRGDVAMAQWLHDNRTEHMRKRDAMLENAAEKGQIAMMEWLRANQMIPTLVVQAIKFAAQRESMMVCDGSSNIIPSPSIVLETSWSMPQRVVTLNFYDTSVKIKDDLESVRWCIEELGAWNREIVSRASARILRYLYHIAVERAAFHGTTLDDQLDLASHAEMGNIVHTPSSGEKKRWILEHVPEQPDASMQPAIVQWFILAFVSEEKLSWDTTRCVIKWRPAFCCHVPPFPKWALQNGCFEDLKALAAIQHPDLFTHKSLRFLLRYTRDDTVMSWFLKQCNPNVLAQNLIRVTRWAAKYLVTHKLQWLLEVYASQDENKLDTPLLKFFGTVTWAAVHHDQVPVLIWSTSTTFCPSHSKADYGPIVQQKQPHNEVIFALCYGFFRREESDLRPDERLGRDRGVFWSTSMSPGTLQDS